MNEYTDNEETLREQRLTRIREMQKRKQQQMMMRRYLRTYAPVAAGIGLLVILLISGGRMLYKSIGGKEIDEQKAAVKVEQEEIITKKPTKSENEKENENGVESLSQSMQNNQIYGIRGRVGNTLYMAGLKAEVQQIIDEKIQNAPDIQGEGAYSAQKTEQTRQIGGEIISSYAIMIDPQNDKILAEKLGTTRINPASMTKVLTVLVAAEHLESMDALEDTIVMTPEITDYGYINDCSCAGFERDEVVTVRELFYGTILPSGADAAMGLAVYIAGSHEEFVELMNRKLQELGMADTAHMTNCVGIYDKEHYCTAYDMAMIMEAALANELCREVMSAKTYTTSITEQHEEGIILSNWFLRRIEDKDTGGEVLCAKTGYVKESGSCAVSYGKDKAGNEYICVTADADSQWKCIDDHVTLYKKFAEGD